ncbi:unnamed protein product [Thlaspi arvense]|uniref:Dehydrogenase/reductase SDR family member 11 n=1 Tax=Thlaspi arvense TaxID=13288 RepID=A0AAU9RUF7_THLAR|nr:unnamed protein product [Thlaspi arvense]
MIHGLFQYICSCPLNLNLLLTFLVLTGEKQVLKQLEPWCELKDKVVLVTGASSGIGKEICLDLGKAGCKIIAAARRVDRINSLCSEINSFVSTGIQAAALELDVTSDAATIQKAAKEA